MDRPGVVKRSLERLLGTGAAIAGVVWKVAAVAKFGSFLVSVAAWTIVVHSWSLAFGFVLLIAIHEFGHVLEARRQGLKVSLPTFIPFIGAYVTIERAGLTPWKNALISMAGPLVGGSASAILWGFGAARGSTPLQALAHIGFLLNAFNMLPIGFLDGGQTVHAAREAWRMPVIQFEDGVPVAAFAPDRSRAVLIVSFYVTLASLLVIGMLATRINGAL